MSTDVLDELEWRGLLAQTTDRAALRHDLATRVLTLYCGFDPSAPSLHAGNLVPLLTLRRFQRAGHRPIVLAGGATGLIGDPRDVGERPLQSVDTVADWVGRIRGQLERFVDFDDSPTGAKIANNLDWTGQQTALEFLRDVGKHFSVNVMLNRETVRRRLAAEGMSYTEFSYLLLQSQDYLHLYRLEGCRLQIGGSDQWGNIVGGVDLIRRVEGDTVHALTVPLVTDSEGRKFGKSTGGGNIWLDPQMTPPYAWYQYFVNVPDADVGRYLRMFTFLSLEEIEQLEKETAERPQLRMAQRRLARGDDHAGARLAADGSGRRCEPRPVRPWRPARARRHDARRGSGGAAARHRAARGPTDDRRPAGRDGPCRQPRGGSPDGERGRCLRQQRQGERRAVGAGGGGPAGRTLAGRAAGEAQPRRGLHRSRLTRTATEPLASAMAGVRATPPPMSVPRSVYSHSRS